MLLTTFLLRNLLKICFTCLSLFACNFFDTTAKLFGDDAWKDYTCDTTQSVNDLKIYTLAQPYYLSDTLLKQNLKVRNVFVALTDTKGNIKIASLENDSLDLKNRYGFSTFRLTWEEQNYLSALIKQPDYLYTRWEKLLSDDRSTFLAKRDSILTEMRKHHHTVKITSDLRSMAHQLKYLGRNRTATPVSMHNFGLAVDIGIFKRRGRMSNNLAYYRPLDSLTKAMGLTWGGNFVGFVDSGHFQLYKNGAELLRKHPELVFEFEPYRPQYNAWMKKMIEAGKEEKAGDTRELLLELNKLKKDQPCQCMNGKAISPNVLIQKIQETLSTVDYQKENDLLLVGDLASQSVSLVNANTTSTFPLGLWK